MAKKREKKATKVIKLTKKKADISVNTVKVGKESVNSLGLKTYTVKEVGKNIHGHVVYEEF